MISFRGYAWIAIVVLCALFWFGAPLVLAAFLRAPQEGEPLALGFWFIGLASILAANALKRRHVRAANAAGVIGAAGALAAVLTLAIDLAEKLT